MNRKLLLITVLANTAYIIWLAFHIHGYEGVIFYLAEVTISSLPVFFLFNHWTQEHVEHSYHQPKGSVDVFISIVNEPLSLFEPVVEKALGITYAWKKIYILDDGKRESIRKLAMKHNVEYISRPNSREDGKAGNLNYGLEHSTSDYILVLDADQEVTNPEILNELLGHFQADTNLAMVATRQKFDVPKNDFNHDHIFYEHMQTGKNSNNAAISAGSGVIYSRKALDAVGGFQTWNIVEDLYTSYIFQIAGFKTQYVNKSYTLGTAPKRLANIYKQRGTWALDTMRLVFKDSPLFKKSLTFRQKVHYFDSALAYIVSAIAVPIVFTMPTVALLTNFQFISDPQEYLLLRVPSLILLLVLYAQLNGNAFSASQWWASLWPVYLKSLVLAILPGKPMYKVTNKIEDNTREIVHIIPHILMIMAGIISVAIYYGLHGLTGFLLVNALWIALMMFWFYPVIVRGLTKELTTNLQKD